MKETDKNFYSSYHDKIHDKRYNSPYSIRRNTHRDIYNSIMEHIALGTRILDTGCGEGVLSILMAQKGAFVTAIDLSRPNVLFAKNKATELELDEKNLIFKIGDSENLSFADNSFEVVVSNHVLEHLPNFNKGLKEIYRVCKKKALIAIPTCLNPCSWVLLGGDTYWKISKRSLFALPLGFFKVFIAFLTLKIGVNEGYAGSKKNIHIHRFPWVMKKALMDAGFKNIKYEAQSLRFPYIPIHLNFLKKLPFFRNLGLGTIYIVEKFK